MNTKMTDEESEFSRNFREICERLTNGGDENLLIAFSKVVSAGSKTESAYHNLTKQLYDLLSSEFKSRGAEGRMSVEEKLLLVKIMQTLRVSNSAVQEGFDETNQLLLALGFALQPRKGEPE